ncbi:MAG: putative signal peptide peptidase SppA [Chlamydiae bacterium]|nr:putative signal peptide peptidase SppA [Chlamydiota bacterium]
MVKEKLSIFKSVLRSFLKAIFVIFGLGIGLAIVMFLFDAMGSGKVPQYSMQTKEVYLPNADGELPTNFDTKTPVLLGFDITGTIGDINLTAQDILGLLTASQNGRFKGRVKALVLHINSPGGDAIDSDIIYRAIKAYKKKYKIPVYAFVEGLCASGGFYIACAADKIYASYTSVIGSVGVIKAPYFNVARLMERFGIESKTFFVGKGKDEMNPFRPWAPDEGQKQLKLMDFFYQTFLDVVVTNRPKLSRTQIIQDYGANIYAAPEAQALGYIDKAGMDYEGFLTELLTAADMDASQPYHVMLMQPKKSFFDFANIEAKFQSFLNLDFTIPKKLQGKVCYLHTLALQ